MTELIRPRGIPPDFSPCDLYLDDEGIKRELDLRGTEHADHYGHSVLCTYFVAESKSKGKIMKAIRQLENTVKKLEEYNYRIDRVVIYCDRLNKTESRIYIIKRDNTDKKYYKNYLYDKSLDKPVEIVGRKRYKVEVIYKRGD